MRTHRLAAAVLALAALAVARDARAWVVVRAPVYHPHPVVVVAPAPVYIAPAPVYVAPAPVTTAPPPAPNALTTKLPINTTMWSLPPGCKVMSVTGQTYHQCGVNWMKEYTTDAGKYYGVVAAP